jgi:tetratricopeptide (TPR) repeat protein
MFRAISLSLLAAVFAVSIAAQSIQKPTLTPKPNTPEQEATIREGISLHDKKDFAGAIAKYKQVLAENPDSTLTLYELALTQYAKGDKADSLETALKGSKYHSNELPLFYGMIANVVDDAGKPDEAIKIYRDAGKILKDEKDSDRHLSSIHFNLGVTYTRQKKYVEAREELKKSIEYNPQYASPHFVLGEVYSVSKYKVPAMLAAVRFVSLEYNTQRTVRSSAIVVGGLDSAKKDEKTGSINIFMDLSAPKDEGDFGMYDLLLPTLMTVKDEKDGSKSKGELFAESFETFVSLLSEDKKLKSTFVGKVYIPYLVELKKAGHAKTLSYLVLRQAGGNDEATKWTELNGDKIVALINWAKNYAPPQK